MPGSVLAWQGRCCLRRMLECAGRRHGERRGAVACRAAVEVTRQVTGIDLSGRMLREAQRAVRAEGLTNADLRKMDAERLEFPDQTWALHCE